MIKNTGDFNERAAQILELFKNADPKGKIATFKSLMEQHPQNQILDHMSSEDLLAMVRHCFGFEDCKYDNLKIESLNFLYFLIGRCELDENDKSSYLDVVDDIYPSRNTELEGGVFSIFISGEKRGYFDKETILSHIDKRISYDSPDVTEDYYKFASSVTRINAKVGGVIDNKKLCSIIDTMMSKKECCSRVSAGIDLAHHVTRAGLLKEEQVLSIAKKGKAHGENVANRAAELYEKFSAAFKEGESKKLENLLGELAGEGVNAEADEPKKQQPAHNWSASTTISSHDESEWKIEL